jgi:hypothetical protein
MNAPEAVLQVLKSAQAPLTHHDLLNLLGAVYEPLAGGQLKTVRRGMLDSGQIVRYDDAGLTPAGRSCPRYGLPEWLWQPEAVS